MSSARWWFLGETICRKWAACIPLFNSKQAYEETKKILQEGEIVGIFPEGHLDVQVRQPKTGAVRLAIDTGKPILPVGMKSSYIPFSSALNVGKPIHPKKGKNVEKQTIDLMEHVYKLRNE